MCQSQLEQTPLGSSRGKLTMVLTSWSLEQQPAVQLLGSQTRAGNQEGLLTCMCPDFSRTEQQISPTGSHLSLLDIISLLEHEAQNVGPSSPAAPTSHCNQLTQWFPSVITFSELIETGFKDFHFKF